MHYSTRSMNSAVASEYSKDNKTAVDENYAGFANVKDRSNRERGYQQHRVALSDVTSQISNKLHTIPSKNDITDNPDNGPIKPRVMMRNETYLTDENINSDARLESRRIDEDMNVGVVADEDEADEEEPEESDDEV